MIYIDRSAELIASEMRYDGSRPLTKSAEELAALEAERRPLYESASDFRIVNDGEYADGLEQLLGVIRLLGICADYAVIGDPISHTVSPAIHGAAFAKLGIPMRYAVIRAPAGELEDALKAVRLGSLKGLSLTKPHKFDASKLADELIGDAAASGSVNTIVKQGSKLIGYNTDMGGLRTALQDIGACYEGTKLLLLGTGGAAAGIVSAASSAGASDIVVAGRRSESEVRASLRGDYTYADIAALGQMGDMIASRDIIINATSLGLAGTDTDFADLSWMSLMDASAAAADLIYSPPETSFLKAAKAAGCTRLTNGLPMLIYQGLIADEIFTGMKLSFKELYEEIIGEL